jgi:type II secretory pathway pseudopilin PulG
MLVVVSILLILTVAVVAVAPRFTDDRKLSRAADQLAQILLTAKQRTKRDQIPTGVRLFVNQTLAAQGKGNLVTELQYIQQPDDFGPDGSTVTLTTMFNADVLAIPTPGNFPQAASYPTPTWWPPPNWPQSPAWTTRVATNSVFVASSINPASGQPTVDFTGGFADSTLWPVQPGDYLSVPSSPLPGPHLILLVTPTTLVLGPVAPFQPASSISGVAGMTLQISLTGNIAQIAAGMIISGPWANQTAGTNTTILTVSNTTPPGIPATPQTITLSAAPVPNPDLIGFLPSPTVITGTPASFSIIRRPRVLQGETPLQLPSGICIDPGRKYISDPFVLNQQDIMFSPQGAVLNSGGQDTMIFWVRDYTKDVSYPVPDVALPTLNWPPLGKPGDQFLILIQTHTGFIAEHPVNVGPGNVTPVWAGIPQVGADVYLPYRFALDARSSGL